MAATPETIATSVPIRYAGRSDTSKPACAALTSARMFAPSTAGSDIKNENRTAKRRSSPVAIPAAIVVPDRESPGIVATA